MNICNKSGCFLWLGQRGLFVEWLCSDHLRCACIQGVLVAGLNCLVTSSLVAYLSVHVHPVVKGVCCGMVLALRTKQLDA
jgi:hypothetical protein